ncbi:sulfurtransferase [Bacillus sp. V5-8f]|uniref:sulfurtransferase n=1 Tax=Bacillus sp. V5-8f TaxID=2053044 RepID=UPI000C767064|nr:sulfurtransferase [Bacillus sp. V5-8f]PLT35147.1 sulfurtransferase [Bacillus sp. V5-8f]
MIPLLILTMLAATWFAYTRHFPVKKVDCRKKEYIIKDDNIIMLDIRDYNEIHDSDSRTLNIPYAYLRRFNNEISNGNIHVIAANQLELNLGVRFLRKKGFNVTSYEVKDCPCKGSSNKGPTRSN